MATVRLEVRVSRRAGSELSPALKIDGGECELHRSGVADASAVSSAGKAVDVLDQRKQRFDRGAPMGDDGIAPHGPRAQAVPFIGLAHDAVANAHGLEASAAGGVSVGLVGIDRPFIAANKLVSGHAVVDVGWREQGAPDDTAMLVHGEVDLIAKEMAGLLPGPGRIGIERATHKLAG